MWRPGVNGIDLPSSATAFELGRAFDRTFAEARRFGAVVLDDLLAVRLGPDAYALRLSEIAGLFSNKKITRLPGRVPALIGIAGFRGAILPVYDLALLIGYPSTAAPQWLVTAASAPVAFAFDGFDGHLRLSRDAISAHGDASRPSQSHVRELARTPGQALPIVHIPSVLDAIKQQLPHGDVRKER
jgi:chemotaxis signal transduction protein